MVLRKSVHPSHLVLRPSCVLVRLRVEQVHTLTAKAVLRGRNGLTSVSAIPRK